MLLYGVILGLSSIAPSVLGLLWLVNALKPTETKSAKDARAGEECKNRDYRYSKYSSSKRRKLVLQFIDAQGHNQSKTVETDTTGITTVLSPSMVYSISVVYPLNSAKLKTRRGAILTMAVEKATTKQPTS